MTDLTNERATQSLAVNTGRASVPAARSLSIFRSISNNEADTDEQLAARIISLNPDHDFERPAVEHQIVVYEHALRGADQNQAMWINGHVSRAAINLVGGWAQSQREEWIKMNVLSMLDLPFGLVERHLEDLVIRTRYHGALLASLVEKIDDQWLRLKSEKRVLDRTLAVICKAEALLK